MAEKRDKRKDNPQLFKPGQSGNPSGRPKVGPTLTDILRELGDLEDVEIRRGEMVARKVALGHKMWNMALQGKTEVMRYIYDRVDGKPTQEIKVASNIEIDAPIHLHVGAKIEVVNEPENTDSSDSDET